MSARSRSPRRSVYSRDSHPIYGKHEKLINSVLKGITAFSSQVDNSVVAVVQPSSISNSEYLEFSLEGTVRNSRVFLEFIGEEGGFENESYFSFLVDPAQNGRSTTIVTLNVAKRVAEKPPQKSWLTLDLGLGLFFVLMLVLSYSMWKN